MNDIQKRIIKYEYEPNCYVLVSGQKKDPKDHYGMFLVHSVVSFLYDAGEYAAEWEVEYGPIQILHRCEEADENAKPHYFYDFENSPPGSWSQLAVEENELPQAFNAGDFRYIFNILKDWADGR